MGLSSWRLPAGVRDMLPSEATCKRRLEEKWAAIFRQWSYREVVTPTFEFQETLAHGSGPEEQLIRFIDRQGRVLVLRPEMTASIARLATSRMQGDPLPLRFFYLANAFRHEPLQSGRQHEFHQAGVELLGAATPRADAEVIALAVESLRAAGLKDFRVAVGHAGLLPSLLDELGVTGKAGAEMRSALASRDLVTFERILEDQGIPPEPCAALLKLINLCGGREVLQEAASLARGEGSARVLTTLAAVYDGLQAYGAAKYARIDLGLVRDLDYYTGVVFEVYSPKLGFPLGGGGRYDRLLASFGWDCPATGFAMGLERVMLALGEPLGEQPIQYFVAGDDHAAVVVKACELRSTGALVEVDLAGMSREEAREYAGRRGMGHLLWIEEEK